MSAYLLQSMDLDAASFESRMQAWLERHSGILMAVSEEQAFCQELTGQGPLPEPWSRLTRGWLFGDGEALQWRRLGTSFRLVRHAEREEEGWTRSEALEGDIELRRFRLWGERKGRDEAWWEPMLPGRWNYPTDSGRYAFVTWRCCLAEDGTVRMAHPVALDAGRKEAANAAGG